MNEKRNGACFDETGNRVVVEGLVVEDKDVVREARRWTTGERGPVIEDPAELAAADLTHSRPKRCYWRLDR
jgi:hypothetical protein